MSYASDLTHLELVFEDNRLIGHLYGQFDQHLALLEQRLGVDATARGNQEPRAILPAWRLKGSPRRSRRAKGKEFECHTCRTGSERRVNSLSGG